MSKASDDICFRKAKARDDETFTLVGKDLSSPRVICEWIKENIETAPPAKLMEALQCAIRMRNAVLRKRAD